MPGQFRLSGDLLVKEAVAAMEQGVPAVVLFGVPDHKDDRGTSAYDPDGVVQQAVRRLKDQVPGLGVITDVCHNHGTWLDSDELEQIAGFILSGGQTSPTLREDPAETRLPPRAATALARARVRQELSSVHRRREPSLMGSLVDVLTAILK